MKTSTIYLSFLFCLGSVVFTSEEEERTFDLASLVSLLGLGTAGLAGAGLATAGVAGLSGLLGGKGGKGKGKGKAGEGLLSGLFGGKGGKDGKVKGKGKGKGKRRSLIEAEQDIQDLSTLLRSIQLVETERHGKGKVGKGKGKDITESSLIDTLSNNILGQIIQAVLGLLTGAVSSLNPFRAALETKSTTAPLPNPLADPMGFIQNPLISAIIQAIVAGDISAMMKAQGDLAGTLITQFLINAISG